VKSSSGDDHRRVSVELAGNRPTPDAATHSGLASVDRRWLAALGSVELATQAGRRAAQHSAAPENSVALRIEAGLSFIRSRGGIVNRGTLEGSGYISAIVQCVLASNVIESDCILCSDRIARERGRF
jgi:hypothetical protein